MVDLLNHIVDAPSALEVLEKEPKASEAEIAKCIAILRAQGYTNRQVREIVGMKNYMISHLKRVGQHLCDEALQLWHNNPNRITLGHVRAITTMPADQQVQLCRDLLVKHITVRQFEQLASNKITSVDDDMARYLAQLQERMSNTIGRPVSITTRANGRSGKITLDWFDFDDFDNLCQQLGFNSQED